MTAGGYRGEARPLEELRAADLAEAGIVFTDELTYYRTTGEHFARGGMGDLYQVSRIDPATGAEERCVGKVFQPEYLIQLRTDDVTRDDFGRNVRAVEVIASLDHPNVLPTYVSARIADNHLTVSPRAGKPLSSVVSEDGLSVRDRVSLLLEGIEGLRALHASGVMHRDFTLRNVLLSNTGARAMVFDFDLALCMDDVAGESYRQHYCGRIFGSPGYSVPPEILDAQLMELAIAPSLDVYAVGGALFNLFTDALPYGQTEDMWGLYLRIADGIVCNGESRVVYPNEVPRPLRPVIERCLEREPSARYADLDQAIEAIRAVLERLPSRATRASATRCATATAAWTRRRASSRSTKSGATPASRCPTSRPPTRLSRNTATRSSAASGASSDTRSTSRRRCRCCSRWDSFPTPTPIRRS
jgi:serine/threonine protein kinase